LDHHFTSHAHTKKCVEAIILKLGWSRSETKLISVSKKIKFEYSFKWIGWEIGENTKKYFITLNIYVSDLV
jgi:hypothetical protein